MSAIDTVARQLNAADEEFQSYLSSQDPAISQSYIFSPLLSDNTDYSSFTKSKESVLTLDWSPTQRDVIEDIYKRLTILQNLEKTLKAKQSSAITPITSTATSAAKASDKSFTSEVAKPTIVKDKWGVKFSKASSNFFFELLPAVSSSLGGSANMDVPGAMPGLSIKYTPAYAKHKAPGFMPIYQSLGVDSILVTLVGFFSGQDGSTLGPDSPFSESNYQISNLTKNTNTDSYGDYTQFLAFSVYPQSELTVEINMSKYHSYTPQVASAGIMRSTNGNPLFKGLVKKIDVLLRRQDKTFYQIELEVTNLGVSQCREPLNLTNILDEKIVAEQVKYLNSCGEVNNQSTNSDGTPKTKEVEDFLTCPKSTTECGAYLYKREGSTYKYYTRLPNDCSMSLVEVEVSDTTNAEGKKQEKPNTRKIASKVEGAAQIARFIFDNPPIKVDGYKQLTKSEAVKTILFTDGLSYKNPKQQLQSIGFRSTAGQNAGYALDSDGYLVTIENPSSSVFKITKTEEDPAKGLDYVLQTGDEQSVIKMLSNPNVEYCANPPQQTPLVNQTQTPVNRIPTSVLGKG